MTEASSEWKFLFSKSNNNNIYNYLDDSFILPGTSIFITKLFVKDNVGVRTIKLKVDNTILLKGECEVQLQYERTQQGVMLDKMKVKV